MTNTVDRNWVRRRMAEVGISSDAELGRRVGINQRSLISFILRGERNIQEDALIAMAKLLRVTPRELAEKLGGKSSRLLKAADESATNNILNVYGTIDDRFAVIFYPDKKKNETVRVDLKPDAGAFALRYETANTSSSMFDGSIAVILEKRDVDEGAMLDRTNLVWLEDGRIVLRRVKLGQKEGHYNLDAANVPPIYDAKIIAFAPVKALLITAV